MRKRVEIHGERVTDTLNPHRLVEAGLAHIFGNEPEKPEAVSRRIADSRVISRVGVALVFNVPDDAFHDLGNVLVSFTTNRMDVDCLPVLSHIVDNQCQRCG